MNKFLLNLCITCFVLHAQLQNFCAYTMSVSDSNGGKLAQYLNSNLPHHIRHHHHSHHDHHNSVNLTEYSGQNDENSSHKQHKRKSPDMWTMLGQTVKIESSVSNERNDFDSDTKYYNDLEQQNIRDKSNREQSEHHKKSVNCPKCKNRPELRMSEEELTNLRIEYVKNQILRKLRLAERPNVSAANIPKPVIEGATLHFENNEDSPNRIPDDYYAKTTQKIIFPQLDNEHCNNLENLGSLMCFTLQIPGDIDYRDIESAELWLYKEPHLNTRMHSFKISAVEQYDTKIISKPFAIQETNGTEDWVKIDFEWRIKKWIEHNNLHHVIEISCNTCEKHPSFDLFSLDNDYRPFIVINTHTKNTINRKRRNINCSAGVSECCREKLYISFADIGWDDWIIHPKGYDAYFCRGSCASVATITMSGSHYNSVVRKVMYQRNNNNNEKNLELVPCCTATQFSPLQLVYTDSNNSATQKILPNMVVEACGCM